MAAVATASAAAPDVVLTDVTLAGNMRGTEAAATIWQRLQIPVIFTTTYAQKGTLEKAKSSTPFGYVAKPYNAKQVHAAIHVALEDCRQEYAR